MRAGSLRSGIAIYRAMSTVNEAGTPCQRWGLLVRRRAEIVQASTEEFIRAAGAVGDNVMIFRVRYLPIVALGDVVLCDGGWFDVKAITEIGRREGTEIRTMRRADVIPAQFLGEDGLIHGARPVP